MKFLAILLLLLIAAVIEIDGFHSRIIPSSKLSKLSRSQLPAVMPGSPIVVGTITQGMANAVGLFSNIILARFALSWFPQLTKQFPILRPIFTVTEPYLQIFRSQIPPVAGTFTYLSLYLLTYL